MFPSKFLQFPSILTHFHAANEKIQNGGRDLAISRGLVWVKWYDIGLCLYVFCCNKTLCTYKQTPGRNINSHLSCSNNIKGYHRTKWTPTIDWWIKSSSPGQNGRHENCRIPIQISLKFVPNGPIDIKPALAQVMAWRRTGNKPLPELMLT